MGQMERRAFIKSALGGGVLLLTGRDSWSKPYDSVPRPNTRAAFRATSEAEVLHHLFGEAPRQASKQIKLWAPDVTTTYLQLPVKIAADLPGARAIALTVQRASTPLAAFVLLSGASCFFTTRLLLNETTRLSAHVLGIKAVFSAATMVRVTRGGYGMHLR